MAERSSRPCRCAIAAVIRPVPVETTPSRFNPWPDANERALAKQLSKEERTSKKAAGGCTSIIPTQVSPAETQALLPPKIIPEVLCYRRYAGDHRPCRIATYRSKGSKTTTMRKLHQLGLLVEYRVCAWRVENEPHQFAIRPAHDAAPITEPGRKLHGFARDEKNPP